MFSCEYCEIFKNSFFHITPLLAASMIPRKFNSDRVPAWQPLVPTWQPIPEKDKSISVYYTVNEWSPFLIDFFRALIFRKGTGFREGWHSRAYFPLGGTYFKTVPSQKFINAKADCLTTVFLASNILLYTFLEDISAREFLSHDNLLLYVLTLVI